VVGLIFGVLTGYRFEAWESERGPLGRETATSRIACANRVWGTRDRLFSVKNQIAFRGSIVLYLIARARNG